VDLPNLYGYAGIVYETNTHKHQAIMQLQAGANALTDQEDIAAELELLAPLIAECMLTNTAITGFKIFNNEHVLLTEGLFSVDYPGQVGFNSDHPQFESTTLTFTGKGDALNISTPGGNAMLRFVCSGAFGHLVGLKQFSIFDTAQTQDLANALNSTNYVWADYYGSRATVRPLVSVQFNAALQKRLGS